MATYRRRRWFAMFLLFLVVVPTHAVVVFAPPDDSPDAANELRGIERELADRNVAAAAKRLDALLAARGDPLASVGEGTLSSTAAWIDRLPADQRAALAIEYAKAFGRPATLLFESVRKSPSTHPEELYAVARRYPLTPAAGLALVEAGDRALQLGDLPAAQAYYEMAPRTGPPLSDARAARLEFLKQVNAGYPVTPPADLADSATAAQRAAFIGPLSFDATWYGNPALSTHPRFFPFACDDRILLATAKGVAMIRGDFGRVVWNSPNPRALAADRPVSLGRGPLFAPAVLTDIHGRPAVVVTRYPVAGGEDSQYVLRAISAADGKTLWTTDATDQPKDLSYAGLPAICGRFVYTLAVTKTGVSTGTLMLCAVDLSTGSLLWQAALGSVAEQGELRAGGRKNIRGDPLSFDAFAELSEPAVAGDCVYVAPNCGSIIAVGRFDGKVRWVHIYREPEMPNAAAGGREPRAKPNRWMDARDAQRAPLLRYRSTPLVCGDAVVVMPQDVPALFAVDRFAGRRLWETDIIEGFGLAGAAGDVFVTCGANVVCGVDAITAKLKWKVSPQKGSLTGPAIVHGQTVLVPTTGGIIQLNVRDGIERSTYALPNFRRMLNNESVRAVLADSYAPRSFGPPAGGH